MQQAMTEAHATAQPSIAEPTAKKAISYIPSLDGLRAISFMIVFIAHAGFGHIIPGGFGVTIFFFLSGYLITTLLRQEYDRNGWISLKLFYIRRTLRIFPPFYLVLLVAVVLTLLGVLPGQMQWQAILAQIFYLSNYWSMATNFGGIPMGTGIFWSLAIEEHFYLVFPAVYILFRKHLTSRTRQMWLLAGMCAAILIWRCILIYGLNVNFLRTYVGTDTRIDSILYGCLLAVYGNPMLDSTRFSKKQWLAIGFPAGVAILLISLAIRDESYKETFRYSLQGIGLIPVFIASIRYHDWFLFKLLNLKWVRFFGVLSYSLYLVHQMVIEGIAYHITLSPAVLIIVSLAASYLLAVAMYYLIDQPFARLRKQYAH